MSSAPFLLNEDDFNIDFEKARLYIDIKRIGAKLYNDVPKQILENQEIVNQLQYQGFSDFKTWMAEIEVMREKAEKWDSSLEYHTLAYEKVKELEQENKRLGDQLSQIQGHVNDYFDIDLCEGGYALRDSIQQVLKPQGDKDGA